MLTANEQIILEAAMVALALVAGGLVVWYSVLALTRNDAKESTAVKEPTAAKPVTKPFRYERKGNN